ncbi:tetratricopeptide repeat protein [Haloflavibacter putidus]|uniref:Uncharacterized protein n=1 Tax=Haloflavibacter putidus TaxID=2576776 RepID=A0A507ZV19_9FLAO|nr:tetratricopeptide repeat protein [Haloflavibacter putidus]TQD40797.1 hypothetical protein FKR84_02110 [Haloflavibacter putidus]
MIKIAGYILLSIGILAFPRHSYAQKDSIAFKKPVHEDGLGDNEDAFQEVFFEALAQKAIENHEKAILALQKAKKLKPEEAIVYFELGKNQDALKDYLQAEKNLLKALDLKPGNQAILTELYQVYYKTHNHNKAINTAKKLTDFDINYYEDLANLYVLTKDYKKALTALDTLDSRQGSSNYRDSLRRKIFLKSKDKEGHLAYLKQKLKAAPTNTKHYLNLIYFYSENGQVEEAFRVAKQVQEIYPDASEAHLALYKMYMEKKQPDKAIKSMEIVLQSETIGEDVKKKVVIDFIDFVQENPNYRSDLVRILGEELNYGEQSSKQLGEYYIGKDTQAAISAFKKALEANPNDFSVIKNLSLLFIETQQYQETITLIEEKIGLFPSQPILYLLQGVAQNALGNYNKAIETLETGLDMLLENRQMQADFYTQLGIAHKKLGNVKKAKEYEEKAKSLKTD